MRRVLHGLIRMFVGAHGIRRSAFRNDLGSVVESYEKILSRIKVLTTKPRYYK